MASPNRDTTAGAAFIVLRVLARAEGRNVAEMLDLYLLEGFLRRLATSPHSGHLVLEGGALLAADGARRPTRDVDLLATDLLVETDAVLALIRDIAALPRDDGLVFDAASATAHVIRDEDEYSGVRITMTAALGRARLTLPRRRQRRRHRPDHCPHPGRRPPQRPPRAAVAGAHRLRAARPARYRARLQRRDLTDCLPQQLTDLLDGVYQFADPALTGDATDHRWDHATLNWT